MIAVRALYRQGEIQFLDSPPAVTHAPVIVLFAAEGEPDEAKPAADYAEHVAETIWGEPIDEEGAGLLVALHEELAPYTDPAERP